jgi:uncharacterized membrane protein YdfJ with MMPL/SSD domain
MIGLGVGIDYSLFIVTRYKERVADGLDRDEAIARAIASSGSAVTFAGSTVVIALVSLLFAGIPLVTVLGLSAAMVVVVAVLAAVTLLPALLSVIGARIDSLRVPFGGKAHGDDPHPHGWARFARAVADRPWPSMALAVVVLVAMAIPILDLRLGQEDVGVLPESTTARQAYDGITEGFGAGTNGPLLIAVKLAPPARNDQKGLDELNDQVAQQQAEATQKVTAQVNALIAEGVPPDEAQAQAEPAAPQPNQAQERKTDQQKKFLKSTASRRPRSAPTARRPCSPSSRSRPRRRSRPRISSATCAPT